MRTVGELVRQAETDYTRGSTQISKYVQFSLNETLERIDAYLNSKHISGDTDALGREKPFFNIVTAAVNVWYRATDIDRKHIRVKATKTQDWIDSLLATVKLRAWMRKEGFGKYLNKWGRTMARYGSAVTKKVENSSGLHLSVIPWNRIICDAVDFDNNPKIEILELTEAELRGRVETHGYYAEQVEALCEAVSVSRETITGLKKDNKGGYIKLYEVHGNLPLSMYSTDDEDEHKYAQQMHVISFVGQKRGRKVDYEDFTLFSGLEKEDPYRKDDLIEEEGRVLAIGAVEHLFEAQWMHNHSVKAVKDTLDIANKLVLQTADTNLVGRNLLSELETGDILVHSVNMPLTKVDTSKPDVVSWQNFMGQWKTLGNEITGVSEAMLGAQPKSGTAWRQTEALLTESYSLFELMTENKALALEDMLRKWIIPHLKKSLDTAEEVTAELEAHEITRIDARYIKNEATRRVNDMFTEKVLNLEPVTEEQRQAELAKAQTELQDDLTTMGNQRFFKPDQISWKEQLKNLEWELEIDITGEERDTQEALTTLNTALRLVVTPGFDQNKKAQAIVGKILELTGAMSPVEYNAIPSPIQPQTPQVGVGEPTGATGFTNQL